MNSINSLESAVQVSQGQKEHISKAIYDLPSELIKKCFEFMSPFLLLELSSVDKKWSKIVDDPAFWPSKVVELFDNKLPFLSIRMKFVLEAQNAFSGRNLFFRNTEPEDVWSSYWQEMVKNSKTNYVFDAEKFSGKLKFINYVEMAKVLCDKKRGTFCDKGFFQLVDESLKNDLYFASEICKINIECFEFVGPDLKNDRSFVEEICKINSSCFRFVGENLRNDINFVNKILDNATKNDQIDMVQYIGKELLANKKFVWSLREISGYLEHASNEIKKDSRFQCYEIIKGRKSSDTSIWMMLRHLNEAQKNKIIEDISRDFSI